MPKETVSSLDFSCGRIVCALLTFWLLAAPARAERPGALPPVTTATTARQEVVVGMLESPDGRVRAVLGPLLRAELAALGLSLIENDPGPDLSGWAETEARRSRTLMAVLLDTRSPSGWRLVIIDATRDRAIARDLAGGIEENAASVEAVVSIVISAANALREGLEVASTPIEAVVGTARPEPATVVDTPRSEPPEAPGSTFVHGGVGLTLSSLSSEAPITRGLSATLAATWRSAFELRAGAARYWPSRIDGPLGAFRIDRTLLGLSAGPLLPLGALVLTPEIGVIAEWLERSEAEPAAGVTAHGNHTSLRVGGLLGLGGRRKIAGPVALELRLGAAYFGQGVEFVAQTQGQSRLTTAWPVVLLAQVGLDVSSE